MDDVGIRTRTSELMLERKNNNFRNYNCFGKGSRQCYGNRTVALLEIRGVGNATVIGPTPKLDWRAGIAKRVTGPILVQFRKPAIPICA